MKTKITETQYGLFQQAFDHFNDSLFSGKLPNVLITVVRKKNCKGYYSPNGLKKFGTDEFVGEIALNPDFINPKNVKDVLSTLVHEMVHLWQEHNGKPPRKCYHNKEWGDKMESVGLMPSDTGKPGGKRTGQNMTHYIIEGGAFDVYCNAFIQKTNPFIIEGVINGIVKRPTKITKSTYICPICGNKAWARPQALLKCGECDEIMDEQ